jgi:hypothetical protein
MKHPYLRLILIILPGISNFHCVNNPISQSNLESYGFEIRAFNNLNQFDTSYSNEVNWQKIYDTLPIVIVNGINLDSSKFGLTFAYLSEERKNISNFNYEIMFKGDTLKDTLYFPQRVDSIYCNGLFLKDSSSNLIDSSGRYLFSWSKPAYSNHFSINYRANFINTYNVDNSITTSDTSITLTPELNYSCYNDTTYLGGRGHLYLISIGNPILSSNSSPNKRNGKLFAYYNIIGLQREFDFYIKKP